MVDAGVVLSGNMCVGANDAADNTETEEPDGENDLNKVHYSLILC